jgi:hypothetical protein
MDCSHSAGSSCYYHSGADVLAFVPWGFMVGCGGFPGAHLGSAPECLPLEHNVAGVHSTFVLGSARTGHCLCALICHALCGNSGSGCNELGGSFGSAHLFSMHCATVEMPAKLMMLDVLLDNAQLFGYCLAAKPYSAFVKRMGFNNVASFAKSMSGEAKPG